MNRSGGQLRIGTSGFSYRHWREIFYPPRLPTARWLEHYVRHFDTVELNNPFYRLPAESTFDSWRRRAPEGFRYAVKMSRYVTHVKRLLEPDEPVAEFMRRAEHLGETLGPILVQLPPRWHVDLPRLEQFLHVCPAARRWVVEFRDPGWLCEPVYDALRRRGVALCIHDMLEDHPRVLTAEFAYLRFHGAGQPDGNYTDAALRTAADWIDTVRRAGQDVYAYFNNDAHGYAVRNAQRLRELARA